LRQSHLGHKQSEATKEKRRLKMLGNKLNSGRKQSDEQIANRIAKTTGRKRSEQARQNISDSLKGRVVSDEARLNMSIAAKNRHKKD